MQNNQIDDISNNSYLQKSYEIYQSLVSNSSGFIPRQNQWQMIVQIAYTLDQARQKEVGKLTAIEPSSNPYSNITVIEAATGIGKSMAYLVALAAHYSELKMLDSKLTKKIVIATATKVLQSQLFNKDIPNFVKNSNTSLKIGLAKGRSSYLCPHKLRNNMNSNDLFEYEDKNSAQKKLKNIHILFFDKCWSGDLDELPSSTSSSIRNQITTETHECLHSSCEFNKKGSVVCPYYKNKEHLRQCDVIITNHSLLLTHMQAGDEGNILPIAWEQTLLCIDEAHNFNNYAINSFTSKFNVQQSINMLEILSILIHDKKREYFIYSDTELCKTVAEDINDLVSHIEQIKQVLEQNIANTKEILLINDYIQSNNILPTHITLFIKTYTKAQTIWEPLQKIQNKLKETVDGENRSMQLGFYSNLLVKIISTLEYIINQDDSCFNANTRWINIDSNGDFIINAGITHLGQILQEKLWNKLYSCCLVSASLTVSGSFDYTLSLLGLKDNRAVTTLKLDSHFNYQEQARLLIANFANAPDYKSLFAFNKELSDFLIKHLDYSLPYGTLVMFFNRKQMIDVYNTIPKAIQDKILIQTDYISLQRMIDDHKKNIDNNLPSIIFGMNSLAEGVDLVSKYCMHVIITKMPFDTPSDPFNIVREYWIKKHEGNFFMEVSLPEAGLKLIQAAGRLIRTEYDKGQITICDNRITSKFYGKILLSQLAHFPRIQQMDKEFLQRDICID